MVYQAFVILENHLKYFKHMVSHNAIFCICITVSYVRYHSLCQLVLSDLIGNLYVFKNCYTSIENIVHTLHESQTYIYLIGHILCADVVCGDNYKTIFLIWREDTLPKTGQ